MYLKHVELHFCSCYDTRGRSLSVLPPLPTLYLPLLSLLPFGYFRETGYARTIGCYREPLSVRGSQAVAEGAALELHYHLAYKATSTGSSSTGPVLGRINRAAESGGG